MPVDFKNKLFQKALWGYVPEEVDEYIAYVAGEYTRLEKRLNAIRAENAKIAAERSAMKAAAEIPGVTASEPAPKPDPEREGVSARLKEAEAVLARAGSEAESTLSRAKEEAETVLSQAKEEAERLLDAARREAGSIRAEAEEDARRSAEEIKSGAEEESARLLADAKEAKEEAKRERNNLEALRSELGDRETGLNARIRDIEEDRRLLDEERAAFERERAEFSEEKAGLTAGQGDADALREEAAEQLRESERILSGLSTAAARFRSDVAAFSSSMRSMAQSQLSAAERFGEDADRFLADVNAFSARNADDGRGGEDENSADPTGEDNADPFGFASAAMMIGELLKDLPDEPQEPEEQQEVSDSSTVPEQREPASAESSETDALLAETAVSEHIAAETDRILDSLRGLTVEEPQEEPAETAEQEEPAESSESAEPEESGEANEPNEADEPEVSAEPKEAGEPDLPYIPAHSDVPDEADTAPDALAEPPEEQGKPDNSEDDRILPKAAEPEPGDEELEAVMQALSGISEDDSYDAILAAFQPEEEVDLKLAEDLEKKRRENFRRMMDEAAAEKSAEKRGVKKEKREKRTARTTSAPAWNPEPEASSLPDDGESDLEKEIAAAVEAAVRAKLDPGQALDEVFAELTGEDETAEEDLGAAEELFTEEPVELPPDMLELLDFDEPGTEAAAYTDHSLAEFTSGRKEPEPDAPDDEE